MECAHSIIGLAGGEQLTFGWQNINDIFQKRIHFINGLTFGKLQSIDDKNTFEIERNRVKNLFGGLFWEIRLYPFHYYQSVFRNQWLMYSHLSPWINQVNFGLRIGIQDDALSSTKCLIDGGLSKFVFPWNVCSFAWNLIWKWPQFIRDHIRAILNMHLR